MNQNIEYRFAQLELRDGDKPILAGYAAVFNSLSQDLGGFREVIRPGAFTRSLASNSDVLAYYDHNSALVLGRRSTGTLQVREDERGLYVEITPPNTSTGKDVVELVRGKYLTGMSFGFMTKKDAWRKEGDNTIRELHDVDLLEASIVSQPAYPATEIALRSMEQWQKEQAEEALRSIWQPKPRLWKAQITLREKIF